MFPVSMYQLTLLVVRLHAVNEVPVQTTLLHITSWVTPFLLQYSWPFFILNPTPPHTPSNNE